MIPKPKIGPEHPNTAAILNNLASLYQDMGEYAKAEPLFQEALQILIYELYRVMGSMLKPNPGTENPWGRFLGQNIPTRRAASITWPSCTRAMGEYAKAEPLYQEALRICQKVLGPEHPYTALCLNNLAGLYWDMSEYAKAEPLLQEALRIRQKVLGPEHLDTAASLNSLALLYHAMGEYAKAESLYQEALRIRQKVLGPEHPHGNQP